MPSNSEYDVIILGGGFAGMNAYKRLVDAGFKALLIEQKNYLGGRAISFFNPELEEEIDNGQHLLLGCYKHTLDMLKGLGSEIFINGFDENTIHFKDLGNTYKFIKPKFLSQRLASIFAVMNFTAFSIKDKLKLLPFLLALFTTKPNKSESVSDLLKRFKQSERIINYFWSPIVIATMNTDIHRASALVFYEVLRLGLFGTGDSSKLLFSGIGLSRLYDKLSSYTASGSTVLCGSGVKSFNKIKNEVRNKFGNKFEIVLNNGQKYFSNYLVSALPNDVFVPLAKDCNFANMLNTTEFVSSPIVSIYIKFKNRINIPEVSALIGSQLEWVFNLSKMKLRSGKNGLITGTVSNAEELIKLSNEDIYNLLRTELFAFFPFLQNEQIINYKIIKAPKATPILTPLAAQQRPEVKTEIENFYLCGDWVGTQLPATIESACFSGYLASEFIIKK